jgi:hypothetical protein
VSTALGAAGGGTRDAARPSPCRRFVQDDSMKLTTGIGAVVLVLAAVVAPPALAQQASPQTGGEGVQLQAKSLMGSTVRTQDGVQVTMDPSQLPQAPAKQSDRDRAGQQQDKKQQ